MRAKIEFLSVVVPVYNEEAGIAKFQKILIKELERLGLRYEVIIVNDGSSDNTSEKLLEIKSGNKSVRVIELTRNFGKEAALSAGLHNVRGDAVVTLDADGQHPPDFISSLIKHFSSDTDMVVGLRTVNPDEKAVKKAGNKIYYRLLRMVGVTYLQPRVTDFRLMDREVVDAFNILTERRRITRGLLDWMGFRTAYVEFESPERLAGSATYSTKKLIQLAVDSILSSSRKPLSLSVLLGMLITSLSLLTTLFVVFEKYVFGDPYDLNISGTAILGLMILFMVGLILITQGISALYLARISEETQQRPLYIIRRSGTQLSGREDDIAD